MIQIHHKNHPNKYIEENTQPNVLNIATRNSRNIPSKIANTMNNNVLQQKLTTSVDHESTISRDIFNFTESDMHKGSPVIENPTRSPTNFKSPEEAHVTEETEQLTPQEQEEYDYLMRKKEEVERRMREIEAKKLLSGKH